MAIGTTTPTSRRALLSGLAGGLVATVAGGLGRSPVALGADPNDVVLGASNSTTSVTSITNTATDGGAFEGVATGHGTGLSGSSSTGPGVYGYSDGYGVAGDTYWGVGVFGYSMRGVGVQASSAVGTGLQAWTGRGTGIHGSSGAQGTGVQGYSGTLGAPYSPWNTGVHGYADKDAGSVGVRGRSPTGRGGVFGGKLAQLRLQPSGAASHPSSGQAGDLFVDKNKRLWFCKGGTTWTELA